MKWQRLAVWLGLWAAGFALSLATAPTQWTGTAWVSILPLWLWSLRQPIAPKLVSSATFIRTGLAATAWGSGFYGGALFWITGIHPMTWLGVPWLASLLIAVVCWLAITFWGIVLVWLWLLDMAVWQRYFLVPGSTGLRSAGCLLWGVASWCALEALWSHSILWWSPIAYTQSPSQLALLQWGQVSGTSLLGAGIMAVNGCFALAVTPGINRGKLLRWGGGALGIWLLLQGGGWWLYQHPLVNAPTQAVTIGIIQGNIGNEIKFNSEGWQRAMAGYRQGYEQLAAQGADAVLTPEGALPYLWETVVSKSELYQSVLTTQVPLWLGAYARKGAGYTNTLFSLDAQGNKLGQYDKVKLVPLGEYIPLQSLLGGVIQRLSPLKEQLLPGERPTVLPTPLGPMAVTICYESAFPQILRPQLQQGAELILSSANNAHYSVTMPSQHHALDVMRAIEGDRWLVRATNTGLSAIISPKGETQWLSDMNRYQIHLDTVYRRQTQTLYVRWGDLVTPLLLLLSAAVWGYARWSVRY